jgi:hypothetical protein
MSDSIHPIEILFKREETYYKGRKKEITKSDLLTDIICYNSNIPLFGTERFEQRHPLVSNLKHFMNKKKTIGGKFKFQTLFTMADMTVALVD